MTTQTTFQLSAVTAEIRKFNEKFRSTHDDWTCLAEWCDDASFFVGIDKIDWEEMQKKHGEVGPLTKAFLEGVYEKRKKLLERYIPEAQIAYDELKARVTTLLAEDEGLKKCLALSSDALSNAFSMLTTVDALRLAMNGYYKLKSDGDEPDPANPEKEIDPGDGGAYCRRLAEVAFLGIKALLSDDTTISQSIIPDEIFSEDTEFLKAPLQSFAKLFSAVKPAIRIELIGRFKKMMRALISCFALYRFPVKVVSDPNAKPVRPGRFLPSVSFNPYMAYFGLELGTFTVTP